MLDTPHDQFSKMEDLRDNAKGQVRFPYMEPDHKVLWVAKKMNWKVLEIGIGQNGIGHLPLLVNKQVLLRVIYSVYS